MKLRRKFILRKYIEDPEESVSVWSEINIPEWREYLELSDWWRLDIKRLIEQWYLELSLDRIIRSFHQVYNDQFVISYDAPSCLWDQSVVTITDKNTGEVLDILYGKQSEEND